MARSFYEDEEHITPVPGTTQPTSQQDLDSLSPRLINGTSIRSPSFLEKYFTIIRNSINNTWNETESKLDSLTSSYHTKEQHFSSTIANLHNKDEDLLPGSIYILIASLTGSIITRRSNILFRGIVPIALGLTAFKLTLPNTFTNSTRFFYKLENENLPKLTKEQDKFVSNLNTFVKDSEDGYSNSVDKIGSSLDDLKQNIKKYGGLNTDDVVTKK
ncbi:hypothetical protein BN7_6062 [Wickerhamomyces ciferrii]|uniref:MICOS complex subunit n=1 Tax=Wickerhamomyces ciferrii (strain ATCC 14091 / BCRC 22168 / CBS 111 / JCM 3599 / NBRC 0793 / NRRL Y-1031 F-60-10) TaxID=1206466 RepID=K0KYF1_WICCF|nr:uncharacterized protein BN7_6062 [Wickerhamomyces ciferrii]CCH46469.1 hypothetical protein BN7_6062 [Wickerhamomyces ciferrii]